MIDHKDANEAIRVYIGYGSSDFPAESSDRLREKFLDGYSAELEALVKSVFLQLGELNPDWSVLTLESAGKWARGIMHKSYPWLDKGALDSMEWAFTWWWR